MTFLATPPRLTERSFQADVIAYAQNRGWHCYFVHDSRHSPKGWPDLVLIRRPRLVFAELKSQRNHLTDDQRACLEHLRACGQEAYCWRPSDVPMIERVLR